MGLTSDDNGINKKCCCCLMTASHSQIFYRRCRRCFNNCSCFYPFYAASYYNLDSYFSLSLVYISLTYFDECKSDNLLQLSSCCFLLLCLFSLCIIYTH